MLVCKPAGFQLHQVVDWSGLRQRNPGLIPKGPSLREVIACSGKVTRRAALISQAGLLLLPVGGRTVMAQADEGAKHYEGPEGPTKFNVPLVTKNGGPKVVPEEHAPPPPGEKYKVVHFVRHGEGYHNIGLEHQLDTHLTSIGWAQAKALQDHISTLPKPLEIQAVFVSPLMRTLETATGVFGGGESENGGVPLMVHQKGVHNLKQERPAVACRPGLPFIAVEECRERMSLNLCDRRRNISETRGYFPGVDFSLIKTDDDFLWDQKHEESVNDGAWGSRYFIGEKAPAVQERGLKFLDWLMKRPETHVAVVSHCAFLHHTLEAASKDLPPELRQELSRDFRNCEMRSVVFNKEGKPIEMLKSTYYPGGANRYYLFPVNWALRGSKYFAGKVGERLGLVRPAQK